MWSFSNRSKREGNDGKLKQSPLLSLWSIAIASAIAIMAAPSTNGQESCALHLTKLVRGGAYGTFLFAEDLLILSWKGPCENGYAEGEGEASGSGWHFRGAAHQGRPSRGWLDFSDGGFYLGPFNKSGLPEGHGISVARNGQIRKEVLTIWRNGRADGEGSFTTAWDGDLAEGFVGTFERGEPTEGRYYRNFRGQDEELRIGHFGKYMHLEGPGKIIFADTAILEASFQEGEAVGNGVYRNPQGVVFDIFAEPGKDWKVTRRSSGVSAELKALAGALAAGFVLSEILESKPSTPPSGPSVRHSRLAACWTATLLGNIAGQTDIAALVSSAVEAVMKERDLDAAEVTKSVLAARVVERIKEKDPEAAALISGGLFIECLLD